MAVYFTKGDDLLNPCWDNVFKAMFTANSKMSRKALIGFLNAVLDRQVIKVTIRQNEPAPESGRERQIRFDINCTFNSGEQADVEMTSYADKSEAARIEYFASKLHVSQDIKGKDLTYDDLKNTYQISILSKPLLKGKDFLHRIEYTDQHGEKLNGKLHIVVVELSKLKEIVKKSVGDLTSLERWAIFFRFCLDEKKRDMINEILREEEAIEMAGAVLQYISNDEDMRARLLTEEKNRLDYQSGMVNARREGEAKGMRKGRAEGRAEGREEGREEGRAENVLEIAKNMKQIGMEAELITKVTGLSAEEIEKL